MSVYGRCKALIPKRAGGPVSRWAVMDPQAPLTWPKANAAARSAKVGG